jgi:predicted Zn-dependent peptidase
MMRRLRFAVALSSAVALLGPRAAPAARRAPAPAPVRPRVERLPDGMELAVIPVPGADVTSLRYVVRAGAAADPAGKAGLAHLLEHLVLQAEMGPDGLGNAVRAAGGEINGATAQEVTVFSLDAPSAAFAPLAERLLRAITNPPLQRADVVREQQVVLTESEYHGRDGGTLGFVEAALFPESSILGSRGTRADIHRDDLVSFYVKHYVTSNTSVVVVGDVTPESARALVQRAVLLPPALETEKVVPRAPVPSLPRIEKVRAPITAAVMGYQIGPEDRHACHALAELLELRLLMTLRVREPLLSRVEADCVTLRGSTFFLVFAFTRTLDAADLPDRLGRAFAELTERPATFREVSLLAQRAERLQRSLLGDPAGLAERAAVELGQPVAATDLGFLGHHQASPAVVRRFAQRNFTEDRKVFLYFSPFEGG